MYLLNHIGKREKLQIISKVWSSWIYTYLCSYFTCVTVDFSQGFQLLSNVFLFQPVSLLHFLQASLLVMNSISFFFNWKYLNCDFILKRQFYQIQNSLLTVFSLQTLQITPSHCFLASTAYEKSALNLIRDSLYMTSVFFLMFSKLSFSFSFDSLSII